MDSLFRAFGHAQTAGNGFDLSETLKPEPTMDEPRRLSAIWNSANHHDAKASIKRKIVSNSGAMVSHDEVTGWVEVYYAYWKALGEILAIEEGNGARGKVSDFSRMNPCCVSE